MPLGEVGCLLQVNLLSKTEWQARHPGMGYLFMTNVCIDGNVLFERFFLIVFILSGREVDEWLPHQSLTVKSCQHQRKGAGDDKGQVVQGHFALCIVCLGVP